MRRVQPEHAGTWQRLRRGLALAAAVLLLSACLGGAGAGAATPPAAGSLLPNGDFAQAQGELPQQWNLDAAVRGKGQARLVDDPTQAGRRLLELRPNARNGGDRPLALGQLLDARPMRGQRLLVVGELGAQGGATAIVGVHLLGGGRDLGHVQLQQADNGGRLLPQQGTLAVPATAEHLIVYAASGGTEGRALFAALRIGPEAAAKAAPGAATAAAASLAVKLSVDASQTLRPIPAALFGSNVEWIFDGQGLWDAKRQRIDTAAIELARQMGPTLLRWPGGVFSDHYRWRDGLGPQDRRPTTLHHPKGPKSRHSFGTDEAASFARAIGADLMITVNVGSGSAEEAADWVRRQNRDAGPRVQWWEVGNELYMKGDLSGGHMSATDYAGRFKAYASAMRAVDPSIRIGAIGGLNHGRYRFIADERWTETLLKTAAPQIDFLAVHNAYAPVMIGAGEGTDPRAAYRAMLASPRLIEANLRDVSALLARHETRERPIAIAITEWGPFWHVLPSSPWVDHVKTMGSALFTASVFNVFLREPRVQVANAFKLADQGFMGWLGRRGDEWLATPSAQVFAMYARLKGRSLVAASAEGPVFDSAALGVVDRVRDAPWVDAVAVRGEGELTLLIVNRHETEAADLNIALRGLRSWQGGRVETLRGLSLDAHNGTRPPQIPGLRWADQVSMGRMERGGPGEVLQDNAKLPGSNAAGGLMQRVPPLSVTAITLTGVQQ